MSEASRIVDVGGKGVTEREATAEAVITMTAEARAQLVAGTPKGNPLEAARVAGVMAVKRTPDLLPFCHPIAVTGAEVTCSVDEGCEGVTGRIVVRATVRASDRTGVEMEALTAAAVGALCLYDTAKPYDRTARIDGVRLLEKKGGKSGHFTADPAS